MEDGRYLMHFEVAGKFSDSGWLTAVNNAFIGGDRQYRLSGMVEPDIRRRSSTLTVDLAPGIPGNRYIQGCFTVDVVASSGVGKFSLLGTGPLGVIIELRATKVKRTD